ncbi:cupin domain-containing protein [Chryseolinea sp. T2]|uniref:cupin domain-containing protein n=1 Tax=Chryseolinea sp. T2 TaxID=3129255 RepID=UPI003077B6A6
MKQTIVNPILKDEVTFTQRAMQTDGRITTLNVRLMPGGGPPMHRHRDFEETFIVLEGELTITLKKATITLRAGEEFTVKRNQAHKFGNVSNQPVEFSTVIRPGSTGFENALCILYGLARDRRTRPDGTPSSLIELAVIARMSDMRLTGMAAMMSPLMILLSIVGRFKRIDEQLVNTYCR